METANYTHITDRLPGLAWHESAPSDLFEPGHFLLLELAHDPSLAAMLHAERETSGWILESLFGGTPAQPLSAVGPHLLAMAADNRQWAALLERLPRERLGIVLQPHEGVTWEALVEHCRRCLWFVEATGRRSIIRWFDPHGLRALLSALDLEQREALLQPLFSLTWHSGHGWYRWTSAQAGAPCAIAKVLQWDADCFERMAEERLLDSALDLVVAYERYLPMTADGALRHMLELLRQARVFGFTTRASQECWLRLYLHCGREFWLDQDASQWLGEKSRSLADTLALLESHYLEGARP